MSDSCIEMPKLYKTFYALAITNLYMFYLTIPMKSIFYSAEYSFGQLVDFSFLPSYSAQFAMSRCPAV